MSNDPGPSAGGQLRSAPQIGDEIGPLIRVPTPEMVRQFVALGTVEGPTRFLDAGAARREGLEAPIVPGAMSLAFVGQLVRDWAPEAEVALLDVIYRGWVHHNETLHVQGVVIDVVEEAGATVVECDVYVETPDGDRPVAGRAVLRFPRP